ERHGTAVADAAMLRAQTARIFAEALQLARAVARAGRSLAEQVTTPRGGQQLRSTVSCAFDVAIQACEQSATLLTVQRAPERVLASTRRTQVALVMPASASSATRATRSCVV